MKDLAMKGNTGTDVQVFSSGPHCYVVTAQPTDTSLVRSTDEKHTVIALHCSLRSIH